MVEVILTWAQAMLESRQLDFTRGRFINPDSVESTAMNSAIATGACSILEELLALEYSDFVELGDSGEEQLRLGSEREGSAN